MNPSCYIKLSTNWPKIKSSTLEDIWDDSSVTLLMLSFLNSSPNTNDFPWVGWQHVWAKLQGCPDLFQESELKPFPSRSDETMGSCRKSRRPWMRVKTENVIILDLIIYSFSHLWPWMVSDGNWLNWLNPSRLLIWPAKEADHSQ